MNFSESEWRVPGDEHWSPADKVDILVQFPDEESLPPLNLRLPEALPGPPVRGGQDDAQQQSPETEQVSARSRPNLSLSTLDVQFDERLSS